MTCLCIDDKVVTATVFDKAQQKFVWLKSAKIDSAEVLWQNREFKKSLFPELQTLNINLFVSGLKTVLVPAAIYDFSAKEQFFTLNHTLENYERIEAYFAKHLNAYFLYAVDKKRWTDLYLLHPKSIIHEDVAWLETLLLQHKNSTDTFVHIDISEKSIAIAAFRNAGLLLYNTFVCETPEDKLYFIMFVSEQLRINPHKDYYFLSGNTNRIDDNYILFARYIKELKFQPRPDIFQYSLPLQELPEHLYFKAFCTPICEL